MSVYCIFKTIVIGFPFIYGIAYVNFVTWERTNEITKKKRNRWKRTTTTNKWHEFQESKYARNTLLVRIVNGLF